MEMGNPEASGSDAGVEFKISPETAALTKSRAALTAENKLYQAQMSGEGTDLSPAQQRRLQSNLTERDSRQQTAQLETEQLERQYAQNEVQLANAREILKVNQGIYSDLTGLAKEGGIARVQYLKQQQEVANGRAKVDQLVQEEKRLKLAIAQARQKLQNTISLSEQDVFTKLADNEKRIAEIDGQLNKAIVENEKQIAEMDSKLKQTEVTLRYQEVRAPVDGTIFDLKASGAGFVATTNEPVLKVVPADALTVEIFIPNKDIGFVKEGMPVDVRIDSFPFSEFGDIKGEVTSIGSDALPPTQIRQFYSFPAKIRMDRQFLVINGREVPLQSGMSVSANIKIRHRTVISIFTDAFAQKIDNFKSVR